MACLCKEEKFKLRQGTSPAIVMRINADITTFPVINVLVKGGDELFKFTREDIEFVQVKEGSTVFRICLTQEQTLALTSCCYVQVRLLDTEDRAFATDIKHVSTAGILERTVLDNA